MVFQVGATFTVANELKVSRALFKDADDLMKLLSQIGNVASLRLVGSFTTNGHEKLREFCRRKAIHLL